MPIINQILEHPSLLAYFSGASNYTWVQYQNGKRVLLSRPLSYFEAQLPEFIRIHKIALINPAFVADVQTPPGYKMPGSVRMNDGTELPVSRRRWDQVQALLSARLPGEPDTGASPNQLLPPVEIRNDDNQEVSSLPLVLAVMTGDALLLARDYIKLASLPCLVQSLERGAEIATTLLRNPALEWPAMIVLDARTNRSDRMLTLQALKKNARLRAIPVIWLTLPGEDSMPAYDSGATSVVAVSHDPKEFVRVIEQLFRYWFVLVEFPAKAYRSAR